MEYGMTALEYHWTWNLYMGGGREKYGHSEGEDEGKEVEDWDKEAG